MSHVDLHLHLLPGVDDGACDVDEALEYARRMVAAGIGEATVTPHVNFMFDLEPLTIPARTAALQAALDAAGVELRLRPGGELHAARVPALADGELEAVAQGPPGARWVLLEAPFSGIGDRFLAACTDLRRRGFAVLVAHPERAAGFLPDGLARLAGELAAGTLLQVNVGSLVGEHGPAARSGAERLVREGLAFVLASDAHPGTRELTLAAGFEPAAAVADASCAGRLTADHPRLLLERGIPGAVDLAA